MLARIRTLDQGRSLRQPSRIMIGSIDHSQPAYFYTSQYDNWPAQHDSNVRPGHLEEIVAGQNTQRILMT